MKKIKSYPTISGADKRVPVPVTNPEALKTSGVAFATYGVNINDVIEFPDSWDDADIYTQPVRANGDAAQTLVGVLRNNKPSYISMGSLRKVDINNVPTCDFTKQMYEMNNDFERLESLFGKKITAKSTKKITVQKFDRLTGERLEGETRPQDVPVIEYV